MKDSSSSLPAWLKWACRLVGSILVLFSIFLGALLVLARLHHPLPLPTGRFAWLARFASNDQWMKVFHGFTGEIIGAAVVFALGILLWWLSSGKKTAGVAETTAVSTESEPPPVPAPNVAPPVKPGKWKFCNVLHTDVTGRRIWQFESRKGNFIFDREQTLAAGQPLPDGLVGKGWLMLWQPRLNIAWLPADKVFLRVAQLPKADAAETQSMLEFQLEKLSPLPTTQIVWSFHILPGAGETQSVVLVIVARAVVEEFLGRLEAEKFLADYLEVPMLDQLQPVSADEEGAWIYPAADKKTALVAWWLGGALQSLGYVYLPAGADSSETLREQFSQLIWAGELEGWLKSPPKWYLAVAPAHAAEQVAALERVLEAPVKVVAPTPVSLLAAATTRRVAQAEGAANLLPAEFTARYHQQFVDGLWLQGLGATLAVYFAGLVVFFVALLFLAQQVHKQETQVADLGDSYTNALQLSARYQVLKDRQDLKFAALDCWKTTAELLPKGATLSALDFRNEAQLSLSGSAPADSVNPINDFNAAMRKAEVNGQRLFSDVETLSFHQAADNTIDWSFSCQLNHTEEEAP